MYYPNNICLFKDNDRNPQKKVWNMFKVNKKHQSDLIDVVLVLTLNLFHTFSSASIVNFEQVNVNRAVVLIRFNAVGKIM